MERRDWLRILDANLNRAREALRVVEDVWRLGSPARPGHASQVRSLRRSLGTQAHRLGVSDDELLAARNVAGDPGAAAAPEDPPGRSPDALARNIARAGEALRVIEESARALGAELATQVAGQARFTLYALQQSASQPDRPRARLLEASLCVIVDPEATDRPLPELAATVAEAGAPLIQLRCKGVDDTALLETAKSVLGAVRAAGGTLIVNDRADVAQAAGADGVHLGLDDMPPGAARAILGGDRLVGATAHSPDEVANGLGAAGRPDYLGYGTVFPSPLKPDRPACGPAAAAAVARDCPVPVFAIGGITPANIGECVAAGIDRVAVASCVGRAEDPGAVVRTLLEALAPPDKL